jgi:hypothetical protein
LAGLVPHLVYSDREAGSPLSILLSARRVARQDYIGDGLVYYALVFPFRLAGDLGGVIMAAGLVAAAYAALRLLRGDSERSSDRVQVFLGLTAVLHLVVLGLSAHGEERFVLFSVLLLTILGVDAVAKLAGRWSAVLLATVASLAVLAAVANYRVVTDGYLATVTAERASLVSAAHEVSSQAGPCLVVTTYQPELGWYSGCATTGFAPRDWLEVSADQRVHLVLFEHGRRQLSVTELRGLLRGRRVEIRELPAEGSLGTVLIVSLPPTDTASAH